MSEGGTIYGPDNKPVRITPKDVGKKLVEWTSFDRYPEDPSTGLTPAKLGRVMRSALDGSDVASLMDLYDNVILKDGKVKSQYRTRRMAVSKLPYEIIAASDDPRDEEIAGHVREQFGYIDNYRMAVKELADATGRGFAALQVMWEFEEGRLVCRRLEPIEQRRFILNTEKGWNFRLYSQSNPSKGEEIPYGHVILHVPEPKGNPLKHGDLMTCLWLWLFKSFDLKSWVQFLEVYGWPFRLGRYEPGADEDDIKALQSAVLNLAKDAGAVIPKTTEIEFFWAQGQKTSDAYRQLLEYCDRVQSEVLTGQSLATSEGTRGAGSYAQAAIHDEVRQDLVEDDGAAIDGTIDATLVAWFVDYKYGPQLHYPRHHLLTEPPEDLKQLSGIYKDAVETGQPIGVNHYSKRFNIPLPEEDEQVLVPPRIAGGGPARIDQQAASLSAVEGRGLRLKDEPAPTLGGERIDRDALAGGGARAGGETYEKWIARLKEAAASGRDL